MNKNYQEQKLKYDEYIEKSNYNWKQTGIGQTKKYEYQNRQNYWALNYKT